MRQSSASKLIASHGQGPYHARMALDIRGRYQNPGDESMMVSLSSFELRCIYSPAFGLVYAHGLPIPFVNHPLTESLQTCLGLDVAFSLFAATVFW